MRKACKMLVVGVDTLKRDVVAAPFFDHVVGAAVEKVSFRYLTGLVARCTTQSGSKMISEEVLTTWYIRNRRGISLSTLDIQMHRKFITI